MNDEIPCKDHPDAPHGFCRDASLSYDRYVCECEFWDPKENKIYTKTELESAVLSEREACAKVCEELVKGFNEEADNSRLWCAAAIRERGEA